MSYMQADKGPFQMTGASAQIGGQSIEQVQLPVTFIDEAVERIRKVCEEVATVRVKLDANADRVFGPVPQSDEAMTGLGLEPTLSGELGYALTRLEEERSRLWAAADRNCFAV